MADTDVPPNATGGEHYGSMLAVYAAMLTMSSMVRFATVASIRSDHAPFRAPVCRS